MPPAARVGDATTAPHGVLAPGPGCPTVLIGGQPAWRANLAGAAAATSANTTAAAALSTAASATAAAKASGVGLPAAQAAENTAAVTTAAAASSAILAAAAGGDMLTCPSVVPMVPCTAVPPPPHGPGVVTRGSLTVRIGGQPAARVGDPIMEGIGGASVIAVGCPTVNIGG